MIPYFLLVILPVLLWALSKKYRLTNGNRVLYETDTASMDIFCLILLLLLALRGTQCGMDTERYLRAFERYGAQSFRQLITGSGSEIGYKLLNKLVWMASENFQILLTVTAILSIYPLWYFFKKESENQLLTILLFLSVSQYMIYFSGIRQAIAMSMGVPAWYFARNRKRLCFIAIVLLAMQIHSSAFMLFLIYPLYHAKITKKWLWFVIPCMVAVFVFRTPIFNVLITLLWEEYDITDATGAVSILILLILFGIYSYLLPEERALEQDVLALRNILLLSIVIQIFAMLHPLSMRMNYYFLIFVPILIPKIANRSKKQYAQIARLSVVIMTVYFIYYHFCAVITDKDSLNLYPYVPFWKN